MLNQFIAQGNQVLEKVTKPLLFRPRRIMILTALVWSLPLAGLMVA